MAKYNQSVTDPAESWVRSYRIEVENPYVGVPKILFAEEQIYQFPDGTHLNKPANHANGNAFAFAEFNAENANTVFNIVDRETGEAIPDKTATYQDVYDLIYSLYMHIAKERDVRVEELTASGILNYDPRGYVPTFFYPK